MPKEPDNDLETLLRMLVGMGKPGELIKETTVNGRRVTTIYATDLECFETAVEKADGSPAPVERYDTKEEALEGHSKWEDLAKDAITVTQLGFGTLIDPEIVRIR